jgi:hypothetical protein
MTAEKLSELVRAAFPVASLPRRYWLDGTEPVSDIPQELAKRIAYRPWVDVTSPSGEGRLVGLVQLVRNSPYGQP